MANGFFLGGVAEGEQAAQDQIRKNLLAELEKQKFGLAQTTQAQNYELGQKRVGIDQQSVDLRSKQLAFDQRNQLLAKVEKDVADTMGIVTNTIQAGLQAGRDPQTILKTVKPLIDNAGGLYARIGRDPNTLMQQAQAMLSGPTSVETATAQGTAEAAKNRASGAGFKFQQIGEDAYGNKQYGFANPATQTVMPAQMPKPPAINTQPGSTSDGLPPEARPDIMHGDEFLRTLPTDKQATVKAIVEGRMAPPSSFAQGKPYWQKTLADVAQYEPGFDLTKFATRNQARKEFNAGGPNAPASQITAGNTAIQHLKQLSDAADALQNYGFSGANWLRNAARTELGSPVVTNYNNILSKFVEEATKFYRGTGGTEADIKRDIENLSPNSSPEQLHQGIAAAAHLMASKINALQSRWKTALGPGAGDFPILQDKSAADMETILSRSEKSKKAAPGNLPKGFILVQ